MLPFTADQFFAVFAEYNRTFAIVVAALWVATVAIAAFAWRNPAARSRWLSLFLGALWLWNALAYHALFFTRINPAAWLFAALFVAQALLFARAAARRRVEFFGATGWMHRSALGLLAYALAYPFLTIALGHAYPAAPTFGVPCPTAILTIGLLLTVRGGVPLPLAPVPIVWGFIGGSAAVLLAVPTDYVLLGAAVLLAIAVSGRGRAPARASRAG